MAPFESVKQGKMTCLFGPEMRALSFYKSEKVDPIQSSIAKYASMKKGYKQKYLLWNVIVITSSAKMMRGNLLYRQKKRLSHFVLSSQEILYTVPKFLCLIRLSTPTSLAGLTLLPLTVRLYKP